MKTQQEIIALAIEKWGVDRQIDKVIEEMSELSKALLKYRHADKDGIDAHSAFQDIAEEHADVLNTLKFLKQIFGEQYSDMVIDNQQRKLERLESILNKT